MSEQKEIEIRVRENLVSLAMVRGGFSIEGIAEFVKELTPVILGYDPNSATKANDVAESAKAKSQTPTDDGECVVNRG